MSAAGRVRAVVRAPDAVLSRAAEKVDPADPWTVALAADLVATMRSAPGCVGLAAPQIGEGVQVFAVDVSGHPKTRTCHGTFVLCNAEVVAARLILLLQSGHGASFSVFIIHTPAAFSVIIPAACERAEARRFEHPRR